ncbi:MAG: lamin tail domain-containing protein [Myxococcota bacterium]|nr:lamin tail domain-containing protein [Myxococcota bacterium]
MAPPLDCPAYAVCVEACDATDIPCIAACGSASEPSVVTAYDELSECLTLVCPTAESGCMEAAIQETGSCFSQHVTCYGCDPLCGAKECGSDGCGGSCGACDTGTYCSLDGLCVDITLEKLVINEVDYDQPGSDDNEFVELLNVGDAPVALINYRLEFVNGANGSVYQNLELGTAPNPVLQPGEYLLVATQPLADNVILISWSIQNGASDGIRLMGIAGNVKDSVSYGGVLSGVTEGLGGAPEDTGVVIGEGISRCVDGRDTEQNSSDFKVTSITPGGPNFCPVCNPSCDGKTCGDDGCGGTCGECAEDSICLPSGTCFSQPVLCADSVSCAKQCVDTGGQVTPCLDSCAPEDNAALDAFITWRQCIEPICSVATSSSCFDATSCSSLLEACVNPCTAVCEGKACGDDGCGGSCGTCDSGEQCTQDGQCDIVTCSNDTSCPAGSQCDLASGICVCAPQCTGKTCGDDGCGGTCGVCPLGSFCLEDGTCELLDCASDSQCPIGSNCVGGQCVCSPSCAPGQQCGGDGCGGQCGQCPNGSICSSTGACIAQPADCSSAFFCTLDCLAIANGDTSSCYDQCQPLTGQSDYMLWFNCIEPACQNAPNDLACISVEPSCADLEALCTSPPCTPNCAGKVCGDDGCGGLCGDCAPGTICSADGSVCDGAGPGLIINEFDYALPGLDEGEFIEIYNIGSDPADLINATLELIDGLTGFAYQTISLTVSPNLVLQPGEYLTLSNAPISGLQTVVTAFELQDSIPSGLALYVGGQLVDFVSYGGTIAGFDQMTGFAPVDDASAPGLGLSRCPNGQDSNDGFIDFILAPTSPTTVNTCQICAPNCDGKNCGDDGCGGQCGVCDPEFECNSQGQCSAVLYNCSDSYACLTECLANSEYAVCAGQCTPLLAEQQLLYQEVLSCVAPGCSIPGAGAECLDTPECSGVVSLCVSSQCQPDCAGKVCGDDGCGGSCGTCTLGSQCLPAGTCEAIGCQSDIDCPVGAGCNLATATCGCVPQCSGKQCGDDGCGGSCGECPNGGLCSVDGLCPQPIDCADGLACLENCIGSGTDIFGCYDTCVPSDADAAIDFQNVYFCAFSDCSGTTDPSCLQQTPACKANYDICKVTCEPACGGKSCGQDGCGGSCGDCDAGDTCDLAGSCVPKATSCAGAQDCYSACLFHTADVTACVLTCEPSSGTAEAISNFFNWTNCIQPLCFGLNGDPQCVNIDPACDDLAAICASDGCTPECSGKQCGGDGCGGSCGSCGIGDECGQTGLCQDIVCTDDSNCPVDTGCIGGTCECVPQCTGKQCGGDGCGGLCGTCGAGESCFADGGCYGSSTTCADGAACFAACVGSNEAPFDCLNTCGPPPDTPARDLFNEWFVCVYPNCDLNPGDATCVDIPECGPALDACQNVVCVPECALKECGDDGCGTSCGLCDSGQVCSAKGVCELDQARLVINEVDHVQSNGTASDFIELLNAGTQPVALLDLFVDISSAESAITQTVALPDAVLLPGGYLIIAQSEAVNQAPSGVLVFELAQAFPDGALGVVLRQSDGTPLDSVSIGASAPSIGEGPKAPADGGLDGVSRCPDGIDSDDNSQDFLVVPVSPGSTNACPVCNPQCGSSFCGPDGCGGLCGVCGDGETCADGQCVAVGCTGQGDCPQGTVCNLATGQCECAPDCTGKNCGSDGCSGVCGTCGVEQECSIEGICVSPIPLGLKVNEVDCIQASDDLLEFVEIYNSSDVSVPLAGKVLELLGADGTAYHVVNLSLAGAELLPGQYLVVGDNELIATITATIPLINEEWDILDADGGVRLLDNGEIIDALA